MGDACFCCVVGSGLRYTAPIGNAQADAQGLNNQARSASRRSAPAPIFFQPSGESNMNDQTAESADSGMKFGAAIEAMKAGKRVARAGWIGRGVWITHMSEGVCHDPESEIEYTVSGYLAIHTSDGRIAPWFAFTTHTLAEDWFVV